MSCDIGCLPVLFHSSWIELLLFSSADANWAAKQVFPFVLISWPVINPSTTENKRNFVGCDYKLFQPLALFSSLSASKDAYLFQIFFFKHIFSPFISLHIAPSLSRVMLLKVFLLFYNEGSWCCQQCLAASAASLFYSGPAKNVWSQRAKTLHPVSHR